MLYIFSSTNKKHTKNSVQTLPNKKSSKMRQQTWLANNDFHFNSDQAYTFYEQKQT